MINVERRERVVHLTINAPPVNVLDAAILQELVDRLGDFEADEAVAAVVLSGEGRCFSAGASVEEHEQEQADGMVTGLVDACLALPAFPAPVIAAVHGSCLGGSMELISFCDFVVADPERFDAQAHKPRIYLEYGTHDELFPFEQIALPMRANLEAAGCDVTFSVDEGGRHWPSGSFHREALDWYFAEA